MRLCAITSGFILVEKLSKQTETRIMELNSIQNPVSDLFPVEIFLIAWKKSSRCNAIALNMYSIHGPCCLWFIHLYYQEKKFSVLFLGFAKFSINDMKVFNSSFFSKREFGAAVKNAHYWHLKWYTTGM